MRRLVVLAVLCLPIAAHADDDVFDPTVDECALPGADCQPEAADPEPAALDAQEMAVDTEPDVADWAVAPDAVPCPAGAFADAGRCVADPAAFAHADAAGGCSTDAPAGLAIAVLGLVLLRKRRWLLVGLAACAVDDGGWDAAVETGALDPAHYSDVYAADLGDSAQYLLANQTLAPGAAQPAAQFALSRDAGGVPIVWTGDRLVTEYRADGELLGWARTTAGEGTAALVELATPSGGFTYETDPDTIAELVAAGYAEVGTLGHVWPPGLTDPEPIDGDSDLTDDATVDAPAACHASIHSATHSALVFAYASPGADESERFLRGCPGEVVIGEKRESGPVGRMRLPENQARGGRTAFVLDRHGDKLRELLLRNNGLERTIQYLKHKLAIGYDYIAIDEVTTAADYRDGTTLNHRLRQLMMRMPIRTIIPYISIDLVQQPNGLVYMQNRKLLLRAFKLRARALALEIYLHTPEVMAGAAPATYRRAADRLALAVHGLARAGGINLRAVSVIGTSMHSSLAQYRYLDQPRHDLESITRQVNAIRHGGKRLRQQHGVGYYFVNASDMAPHAGAPYSYAGLIRRMRLQALRFR